MSRAGDVLFRRLWSHWLRRRLRVFQLTEQSSVVDKWRSSWYRLNFGDYGHPGEEIRTKDWYWSWVTAWLPLLNIWRYIPLLLIFGRFINASIRPFPWRGIRKLFQSPPRLLEIYLFTTPLVATRNIPWPRHPHNNSRSDKFLNITKLVILTVIWIPSVWIATHRYDSSPPDSTGSLLRY
jgi:hypothetical protein